MLHAGEQKIKRNPRITRMAQSADSTERRSRLSTGVEGHTCRPHLAQAAGIVFGFRLRKNPDN
jgi:hypothetical protein